MTRLLVSQSAGARILRAARRVLLVVAALALLGAQAVSTLHLLLVPHHLCAVHGALEDGISGAKVEARHSQNATTVDAAEPDTHEACSLATRTEHGTVPARPALGRAEINSALVAAVSAGIALKPDRSALLSGAPKTSPPARA